tara:strand:+ start:2055 stop:2753 length:699 start_codon:yes stop_codon:yes gene_type:complete
MKELNLLDDQSLVLIPAYNEENRIGLIINECKKYFKNILVVDDGSIDNTYKEIKSSNPSLIIRHCHNCGQGAAIKTGIKYFLKETNFSYLITLDADAQHLPENAKSMLNYALKNDSDAVFGSRFLNSGIKNSIPYSRKLLIKFGIYFEKVFYGIKMTDAHNGLRVLSRTACRDIQNMNSSDMAHATEIVMRLMKSSLIINEYPCQIMYKKNDKESQSPLQALNIISDLIQKK